MTDRSPRQGGIGGNLRRRTAAPTAAMLAPLMLAACGKSASEHAMPAGTPDAPATAASRSPSAEAADVIGVLSGVSGLPGSGRPIPHELVLGGDCPAMGAEADTEIAAQASADVPLVVGLTLTSLWNPTPAEEYECLKQVTAIDRDGIDVTSDCDDPRTQRHVRHRICRADLDDADMLKTGFGGVTVIDASGGDVLPTAVGATAFTLSRIQFAELKRTGSVRHRYVQPDASGDRLEAESTAVLRLEGTETARVAVNDRVIEIPVVRVSGEADHWRFGRAEKGKVTALIADDERFPFLVDYLHTMESSKVPHFRLNHAKISFPDSGSGAGEMERRLGERERIDVYGVYFDYNSARLRRESEPVLAEIADMLRRNPNWNLDIGGHTDNVGGDAYNLDLSRRRSEAVLTALVQRGIAAERLTATGYGAAAPRDTNDTPEGRARNRRVELVRE